jgi:Asp/Glu/hydantoin racemase
LGPEEPDELEVVGEAGVCVLAAPGAGKDVEGSVIEAVDPPGLDVVTEMLAVPVTARVPPPWIGWCVMTSVCVAVLPCASIVHTASVLSEKAHCMPMVNPASALA